MLVKFITHISKNEKDYTFYGDGQGDYEIWYNEVPSKKLLVDYIKNLENQIKLAKEILEQKEDF